MYNIIAIIGKAGAGKDRMLQAILDELKDTKYEEIYFLKLLAISSYIITTLSLLPLPVILIVLSLKSISL